MLLVLLGVSVCCTYAVHGAPVLVAPAEHADSADLDVNHKDHRLSSVVKVYCQQGRVSVPQLNRYTYTNHGQRVA